VDDPEVEPPSFEPDDELGADVLPRFINDDGRSLFGKCLLLAYSNSSRSHNFNRLKISRLGASIGRKNCA
jgi:hypothetical protein